MLTYGVDLAAQEDSWALSLHASIGVRHQVPKNELVETKLLFDVYEGVMESMRLRLIAKLRQTVNELETSHFVYSPDTHSFDLQKDDENVH